MLDSVIFWAFAVLAVGAALGAVLNRSIINAALCLIVVFLSVAGFFLLNNADFLAIAQIIIYAVGLTIMMLFAIMFTGEKTRYSLEKINKPTRVAYGIVLAYVFALLVRGLLSGFSSIPSTPAPLLYASRLAQEGSTVLLGQLLFTDYALPFEVASILLLAAMIGAIVIAKKRFTESDTDLGAMRLPVDLSSAPTVQAIEALRERRLLKSAAPVDSDSELKPETFPELVDKAPEAAGTHRD
jgi:NADH:ubiquinone oxidoreductase subunit 6 (subunit J)